MPVLKLETYCSNALDALSDSVISAKYQEVLAVLQEAKTPIFREKSSYQKNLDLVHPVLNAVLDKWFSGLGWERQAMVAKLSGDDSDSGSIDFVHKLADGRYIALEIQFGNGGRLERDFFKFQALHQPGRLALSVIAYFTRDTACTADSGLAMFETAVRRKKMHGDLPLCIIGVSRDDTPETDLAQIPGIVFPSVLGGSGTDKAPLIDVVAEALVNDKNLAELRLPQKSKAVIRRHAVDHFKKMLDAFELDMVRALAATDPRLRQALSGRLTEFFRNSYSRANFRPHFRAGAKAEAALQAGDMVEEAVVGPVPRASEPLRASQPAVAKPPAFIPAPVATSGVPVEGVALEGRRATVEPAPSAPSALEPAAPRSTLVLPCAGGRRVRRAEADWTARTAASPQRYTRNPAADVSYPTGHFAMAGAFADAFRAKGLSIPLPAK